MAKFVTWKEGASWSAREIGKAEGFSKDYRFDAANQHTTEMEDEDIDRMQAYPVDAKEFRVHESTPKSARASAS